MYKGIFLIIFVIMLAFAAIFYLPYYIKPFEIAISSSHNYGCNNNMAVFTIVVFIFLLSIFMYKYSNFKKGHKPFFIISNNCQESLSIKHFLFIASFYIAVISLLYILTANITRYAEAGYFFDKIDRILIGQRPYLDFAYIYGPIFLYTPVYIFKGLKNIGVDLKTAYYIAYTFFNILGLYFLFYLVNKANLTKKQKMAVFYLVAIPGYPLTLGFNGIFMRFITPYFSLFLVDYLVTSNNVSGFRKQFTIILLLLFLFLFNLSISPEIGLVFSLSALLYLILITIFYERRFIITFLSFVFLLSFAIKFIPPDFILILKSVFKGGYNFPVVPSPSILLYLFSLFLITTTQIARYTKYKKEHLIFVLSIMTILMMPAVMGICEAGHVFLDGLGLFLLSFIYMAHISKAAFRIYSLFFLIVFSLGLSFSKINFYKPELGKIIFNKVASRYSKEELLNSAYKICNIVGIDKEYVRDKIEEYFLNKTAKSSGTLDKYPKIATPFFIDERIYHYLLKHGKYVPEYYIGLENVFTVGQIQKKLSQLKDESHKIILINDNDLNNYCTLIDDRKALSWLFLYPFNNKPIRNTWELYLPLYDYIRTHYKVIDRLGTYVVMERQRE